MAASIASQLYVILNEAPALLVFNVNRPLVCSNNAPLTEPPALALIRNFPSDIPSAGFTTTIPVQFNAAFISKSFGTTRMPKPVRGVANFRLLSVITTTAG